MKLISFNINGIRAHFHQLEKIIIKFQPDIIALQETKIHDTIFPVLKIKKYGYYSYFYGQTKYYGVAFICKQKAVAIYKGLYNENEESQKRVIIASFNTTYGLFTIINGYFPQGNNRNNYQKFLAKKIFYQNIKTYLINNFNDKSILLITGDMNVAPADLDVGIGKKKSHYWLNTGKCSFLPEERIWLNNLFQWGLTDIYRYLYPNKTNCYSWFDYKFRSFYKNQGLRIDLFLASIQLIKYIQNTGINYEIRAMQKTSDHAPIWVTFKLKIIQ